MSIYQIPDPNNRRIAITNRSDVLGNIERTFNMDLTQNEGGAKATRMRKVYDSDSSANLKLVEGFVAMDNTIIAITHYGAFISPADPTGSGWTFQTDLDAPTSADLNINECDIAVFDGNAYVAGGKNEKLFICSNASSDTWDTALSTTSSPANRPHILEVMGDFLYMSDGIDVGSITTTGTVHTSTYTLSGVLPSDYEFTWMVTHQGRIWLGTKNYNGKGSLVIEWDGITQNTPNAVYTISSPSTMAGLSHQGDLYCVDTFGRLLVFNGAGFQEVARIPIAPEVLYFGAITTSGGTFLQKNGLSSHYNKIVMNLNLAFNAEEPSNTTASADSKYPSGIYEYDPNIGIYHKYSISTLAPSDTDITANGVDYGQMQQSSTQGEGGGAGALLVYSKFQDDDPITAYKMSIINGAIYLDGSDDTEKFGIFVTDLRENIQKYGWIQTSFITSPKVASDWVKAYVNVHIDTDKTTASDNLLLKYRLRRDDTFRQVNLTFTSGTTFTTTGADASGFEAGMEVQFTRGVGAGFTAHISSISEAGGTYTVTVDRTVPGAANTYTGVAQVEKWTLLREELMSDFSEVEQFMEATIGARGTAIQFKICMRSTGEDEFQYLTVTDHGAIDLNN